jgi:hypothetical protein
MLTVMTIRIRANLLKRKQRFQDTLYIAVAVVKREVVVNNIAIQILRYLINNSLGKYLV